MDCNQSNTTRFPTEKSLLLGSLLCVLALAQLAVGQDYRVDVESGPSSSVPRELRLPAVIQVSAAATTGDVAPAQHASHAIDATPVSIRFSAQQLAELEQLLEEYGVNQHQDCNDLQFGYDNGFVIASPDGLDIGTGDVPFAMRINSWVQMRHTLFDSDGPNPDENDFEFERVRLTFGGHAYTPDLEYYLQLDGDGDQGEVIDLLDYYFHYDVGHDAFGWRQGRLALRVGKWKLPYNRTRHEAGWQLEFTDRSMASVFFDINRSQGLGLFGTVDPFGTTVNYEAAVFNGFETEGFASNRGGDLDRNLGCSARVYSDLIGDWGKDGEPDLSGHANPAVRVGSGFAYNRVDAEGPREFTRQRVVDSGATLASILPPGVTAYDIFFYAADLNFKYHGLSFHSEVYARSLSNFAGVPVPALFDHGLLLQLGHFVVPEKLELATRWSRINGDSRTLGVTNESADEVAAALIWYIRGHNVKLTFDATHLNGAPIRDLALNILPGDAGWLFRSQLQVKF